MDRVTRIEDLAGKTILKAAWTPYNDVLSLRFTDDSFVQISAGTVYGEEGDEAEMVLDGELITCCLVEDGIIDEPGAAK